VVGSLSGALGSSNGVVAVGGVCSIIGCIGSSEGSEEIVISGSGFWLGSVVVVSEFVSVVVVLVVSELGSSVVAVSEFVSGAVFSRINPGIMLSVTFTSFTWSAVQENNTSFCTFLFSRIVKPRAVLLVIKNLTSCSKKDSISASVKPFMVSGVFSVAGTIVSSREIVA
jgi:hypothetical protein